MINLPTQDAIDESFSLLVVGLALLLVTTTFYITARDNHLHAQTWIYEHIPCGTAVHLLGAYNVPPDPLNYTLAQTYLHGLQPGEIATLAALMIVYSDSGAWGIQRDSSAAAAPYRALENGVAAQLDTKWTELVRFERMPWPGATLSP